MKRVQTVMEWSDTHSDTEVKQPSFKWNNIHSDIERNKKEEITITTHHSSKRVPNTKAHTYCNYSSNNQTVLALFVLDTPHERVHAGNAIHNAENVVLTIHQSPSLIHEGLMRIRRSPTRHFTRKEETRDTRQPCGERCARNPSP